MALALGLAATSAAPSMANNVVCHCAEGELRMGAGVEFVAKKGDVWSCNEVSRRTLTGGSVLCGSRATPR